MLDPKCDSTFGPFTRALLCCEGVRALHGPSPFAFFLRLTEPCVIALFGALALFSSACKAPKKEPLSSEPSLAANADANAANPNASGSAQGPSTRASTASAANENGDGGRVEASGGGDACPSLGEVAPFATCDDKVVKTPLPEIVDENGTLSSFQEKLAALERGTAKKPVRIAIYGDSNLTSDFLPGHLRRILQTRYGDAGHGWVSLSRPWLSYRHEDVAMGGWWGTIFTYCTPTTNICNDKQYGFANMAAETNQLGAMVWAGTTTDKKSIIGHDVSHFELHYLRRPNGGHFTVQIDKKDVRVIDTKWPTNEVGIDTFDVPSGPHELRNVVRGDGNVRFFGVSLDNELPAPKEGIQIDSLGAGSLNYERLRWVADDTRRVQLARRDYDLVIIWLGMNVMFLPPNRGYAKEFIAQIKGALPNAAILILSPGDTVRADEKKSDPRIVAVARQMREVAQEAGRCVLGFPRSHGRRRLRPQLFTPRPRGRRPHSLWPRGQPIDGKSPALRDVRLVRGLRGGSSPSRL